MTWIDENRVPAILTSVADFTLADGFKRTITAEDSLAALVVSHLMKAMQLQSATNPGTAKSATTGKARPSSDGSVHRRFTVVGDGNADIWIEDSHLDNFAEPFCPASVTYTGLKLSGPGSWARPGPRDNPALTCVLQPFENDQMLAVQLMRLALTIAREAETDGGLLIHGGLAEKKGQGVILAGPGGIGKTTASSRLSSPWHSLSDDTSLVVSDKQGVYWAHPWPTWSRFMFGGPGGQWNVQNAVPLKAIFFLSQASEIRAETMDRGKAICRLLETVKEASSLMSSRMFIDEIRAHNLQRFDNACEIVRSVPCYDLRLSMTGAFWNEIERVQGWDRS